MPSATPLADWIGFHVFLVFLLVFELAYARRGSNRGPRRTESSAHRTALFASILWVAAALVFSVFIYLKLGGHSATEYLAGYAIEESLSVDNLFLFLLLFRVFRIDPANQPRVLFWGVAGAIIMRGAFIAAGLGLLQHFHWISYLFGLLLLLAAIRLLKPEDRTKAEETPRWIRWISRIQPVSLRQDAFFVYEDGRRMATMLFLALLAIELTDVVFALDSIPAVLSITRDPFLAYTSNIMAVMGLRSLFFLLARLLTRLQYLHYGLAAVLAFAGLKMLLTPWIEVGALQSLGVIVLILATTVLLSLRSPSSDLSGKSVT